MPQKEIYIYISTHVYVYIVDTENKQNTAEDWENITFRSPAASGSCSCLTRAEPDVTIC